MTDANKQTPERVSLFSAATAAKKNAAQTATESTAPSTDTAVLSPYGHTINRTTEQETTQVFGAISQTLAPAPSGVTPALIPPANTGAFIPADNNLAIDVKNKKNTKKKVKTLIGAGAFATVLVAGYFSGTYIYSHRFFPNTTFGSVNVSNMAFADAQTTIEESARDYSLAVAGQGLDFAVTPAQSGMKLNADAIVTSARKEMNPWVWPIEVFTSHNVADSADVTVNGSSLGDYIKQHVDATNAMLPASEDARIEYDEGSSQFAIIPEVYGEQLDSEKVASAVTSCILHHVAQCDISAEELLTPSARADDKNVVAGMQTANDMLGVNASFKSPLDNDIMGTLDASVLVQWITFDKNFKPSVDQDALTQWSTDMVSSVSTVGTTRTFTRSDGKQITVSGGTFGCEIDNDAIVLKVNEVIDNKTRGDIFLERTCSGIHGRDGAATEWGAYVDVDLTEQFARYYDDSGKVLWESPIVSGNPNRGWATPTGVWYINNKQQGTVLRGQIDEKTNKPSYELPVDYWMPFINNMVGLHDVNPAVRPLSTYGTPNIQYTNGSHGCINVPPAVTAKLFSLVSVGTPVVVHN